MHLWYCLEHLHLQKGRKCTQVTEGREGEEGEENINCLLDETTRIQLPTGGFEKRTYERGTASLFRLAANKDFLMVWFVGMTLSSYGVDQNPHGLDDARSSRTHSLD